MADLFRSDVERLDSRAGALLRGGFTFANVGASDGVTADPIYPLAERYGAAGVAAEPIPYIHAQLVRNYAHHPAVVCMQVAVSDEPGEVTMWYIEAGSGAPEYLTQSIASLDRDRLVATIEELRTVESQIGEAPPWHPDHLPAAAEQRMGGSGIPDDLEEHIRSVVVEAVTFDDLMDRAGIDRVDVVNVDLEGHDFAVFQSVDWERWSPRVMILETVEMTDDQKASVASTLEDLRFAKVQVFGLFSDVYVRT